MKKFLSACIIMMLIPIVSFAQDDVTKKEENAQVTVHQDAEINSLLYENKPTQQEAVSTAPTTSNVNRSTSTSKGAGGNIRAKRTGQNASMVAKQDPNTEDTKHQYIDGFRIQVCSRGNTNENHEEVKKIGQKFKGYFREWRVEILLRSPRWVCLAGDFRTRKEAQAALKRIQYTHKFKSCTIVRAKIKNAKYNATTSTSK